MKRPFSLKTHNGPQEKCRLQALRVTCQVSKKPYKSHDRAHGGCRHHETHVRLHYRAHSRSHNRAHTGYRHHWDTFQVVSKGTCQLQRKSVHAHKSPHPHNIFCKATKGQVQGGRCKEVQRSRQKEAGTRRQLAGHLQHSAAHSNRCYMNQGTLLHNLAPNTLCTSTHTASQL